MKSHNVESKDGAWATFIRMWIESGAMTIDPLCSFGAKLGVSLVEDEVLNFVFRIDII